MKSQNETPKAAFGSILLEIVRDGLGTERVSGSAPTPMYLRAQQTSRKKKNPPKKKKTMLICNCKTHLHGPELRSDTQDCNVVTELLLPERCAAQAAALRNREKPLLWGSIQPKTWDCPLHSAHTLRNVCSSLRSLRDTLDSSQKPAAPPNNEFFWGKPVQNKQRGILSETLHIQHFPHSTCRKRLGDVLHLHSFKKINLLLTYCLPE